MLRKLKDKKKTIRFLSIVLIALIFLKTMHLLSTLGFFDSEKVYRSLLRFSSSLNPRDTIIVSDFTSIKKISVDDKGQNLAILSNTGEIEVWDIQNSTKVKAQILPDKYYSSLEFSSANSTLLASNNQNILGISFYSLSPKNSDNSKNTIEVDIPKKSSITTFDISNDEKTLAFVSQTKLGERSNNDPLKSSIYVWSLENQSYLCKSQLRSNIDAITVSEDGDITAAITSSYLRMIDTKTCEQHDIPIYKNSLESKSYEQIRTTEDLKKILGDTSAAKGSIEIELDRFKSSLALNSVSKNIVFTDRFTTKAAKLGKERKAIVLDKPGDFRVNSVALNFNGRLIASGNSRGEVKVWDAQTYQLMRTIEVSNKSIQSMAFINNSQKILVADSKGYIYFFDLNKK